MTGRRIALALITALAVAACGGTGASSSAPAAATPASAPGNGAPAVTIANFAFAPADLTVAAGSTVTWKNSDGAGHTVKSVDGGFASSGTLKTGDAYSVTFSKAGTFAYVCAIHSSMHGTITVTP